MADAALPPADTMAREQASAESGRRGGGGVAVRRTLTFPPQSMGLADGLQCAVASGQLAAATTTTRISVPATLTLAAVILAGC